MSRKRKLEPDEGDLHLTDHGAGPGPSSQQQQKPGGVRARASSSRSKRPRIAARKDTEGSDGVRARASSSKSKRSRKDAEDSDATLPEQRGAMFKRSCPQKILERVERVMSQRFFMIDRRREGDELREDSKFLGQRGMFVGSNVEPVDFSFSCYWQVYTVVIDKFPSCNCPDASRGNHCKHILFIFLKVLQLPQSSGLWYQKALLASELQTIFADAPQAPNALAHERVRNAYALATGKAPISASSAAKRRIPGPEDSCPICYESMHGASQEMLVFCEECGNALHSECFEQWRRSAAELTCVWCRAKWQWGGKNEGASRKSGAYINLSEVAGLSGVRDTSTYHQSARYRAS
ncbi:hypothetical protein BJV78DRAFT_37603 [Lactifluus subvellereus]|nr:hypothetical protein BJV78DRAFT_37603 [Lactifluus subvellereus]